MSCLKKLNLISSCLPMKFTYCLVINLIYSYSNIYCHIMYLLFFSILKIVFIHKYHKRYIQGWPKVGVQLYYILFIYFWSTLYNESQNTTSCCVLTCIIYIICDTCDWIHNGDEPSKRSYLCVQKHTLPYYILLSSILKIAIQTGSLYIIQTPIKAQWSLYVPPV